MTGVGQGEQPDQNLLHNDPSVSFSPDGSQIGSWERRSPLAQFEKFCL